MNIILYIDADACPVKDEAYRVAQRHGLRTFVVANSFMAVPRDPMIERVVVPSGPDVADDWIVERANEAAVVITSDIPLADRCVKAGASVIAPNGKAFTSDFDRNGARDAQPHDGPALGGRHDRRSAPFRPQGSLGVPFRAGRGGQPAQALRTFCGLKSRCLQPI